MKTLQGTSRIFAFKFASYFKFEAEIKVQVKLFSTFNKKHGKVT